jgi:hypothetical protein
MIMVTAQGRDGETRTTRFTLPNGDLAAREREESGGRPNSAPTSTWTTQWVFDWKGESETMKWLEKNDKKRFDEFKASLEILENSRVIFEVAAYDNVNKYVRMEGPNKEYCKYGIWTPQVMPKDVTDLQFERPMTWKINDPTVPDEEMLYEDRPAKVFVYPDYIYRRAIPEKMAPSADGRSGYGVEVLVERPRLVQRDPARTAARPPTGGRSSSWFNVLPSEEVGVDRMGNQEGRPQEPAVKPTDCRR